MGQLIFLLLLAFAIICAMYGLAQGVQTVQDGLRRQLRLGRSSPNGKQRDDAHGAAAAAPSALPASPMQRCLGELQTLQQLYQTGG